MKIKTFKVKDFNNFSENVNNFIEGKKVTINIKESMLL